MIKPLQHFIEGSTCKNFMNHNLLMRHNHIHIQKMLYKLSTSISYLGQNVYTKIYLQAFTKRTSNLG